MLKLSETDLWCVVAFIDDSRTYLHLAATCKYLHRALVETEYRHIHRHLVFFSDDGYVHPPGCRAIELRHARFILGDTYHNKFCEGQNICRSAYRLEYIKDCVFNDTELFETIISSCVVHNPTIETYSGCSFIVIEKSLVVGVKRIDKAVGVVIRDSIVDIGSLRALGDLSFCVIENCTDPSRRISISKLGNDKIVLVSRVMTRRQIEAIDSVRISAAEIIVDADGDPDTTAFMVATGGRVCGFICRLPIYNCRCLSSKTLNDFHRAGHRRGKNN